MSVAFSLAEFTRPGCSFAKRRNKLARFSSESNVSSKSSVTTTVFGISKRHREKDSTRLNILKPFPNFVTSLTTNSRADRDARKNTLHRRTAATHERSCVPDSCATAAYWREYPDDYYHLIG